MDRSTALVLGGVVLLIVAVATPLAWLASAQWDTEYVYMVETDDTYCASVVDEGSDVEGTGDFRITYQNLSATGQEHVEQAITDGRYVVGTKLTRRPTFSSLTTTSPLVKDATPLPTMPTPTPCGPAPRADGWRRWVSVGPSSSAV